MFVLSSKFEGLPTVLLETMIILSNCKTGPTKILKNGVCGDLFEVGDVDKLALLIGKNLINVRDREEKIALVSKRVKEFDKQTVLSKLAELL